MLQFSSKRERRLWYWAIAVIIAIYATLGLAGEWVNFLEHKNLLGGLFMLCFVVILLAIVGIVLVKRPNRQTTWVILGIIATYLMVFVRLGIGPVERTHLFEYGLVAILIHQALLERKKNGQPTLRPALSAIIITILLGWIDEGIQAILPNRVYDIRDVLFNSLAGLMSVLASLALMWAQRKKSK